MRPHPCVESSSSSLSSWAALVVLVVGFLVYVQVDGIPRYPGGEGHLPGRTHSRADRPRKEAGQHGLCANCHMDPTTRR